jgi:DMSO/TMAO reductase YedYZ heme-binding membrane subunit
VGKTISWNDWFFILNKAIAWTGFSIIALSVLQEKVLSKIQLNRRSLGMTGFGFALFHAISVLCLFNEEHFPKFYTSHSINLIGWISISIGILSIVIFSFPFVAALKKMPSKSEVFKLGKIGVMISLFHPLMIGFSGWLKPAEWPFYLPPITMLAVLLGVVVLVVRYSK